MNIDISKSIIRIVQDYCFNNSAPILSYEFSLFVSSLISDAIEQNDLSVSEFIKKVSKRKDFFQVNNVNVKSFCKGLFEKLNYEFSFLKNMSFSETITEFKRKMENGVFKGFPLNKINEDTLRGALVLFLRQETFCEPRSGAGNNDITIPSEKTVIETKLWKGKTYFYSGIPELYSYLLSYNYSDGYYVIFDYNQAPNEIIQKNSEIFDIKYKGKKIHTFFIKMNAIPPSKIYKESKKPFNSQS